MLSCPQLRLRAIAGPMTALSFSNSKPAGLVLPVIIAARNYQASFCPKDLGPHFKSGVLKRSLNCTGMPTGMPHRGNVAGETVNTKLKRKPGVLEPKFQLVIQGTAKRFIRSCRQSCEILEEIFRSYLELNLRSGEYFLGKRDFRCLAATLVQTSTPISPNSFGVLVVFPNPRKS